MAASFTVGGIVLDSPEAKIFDIDVPEGDPVDTATALTFAGGNMVALNAVPQEVFFTETTEAADAPTVTCNISLDLISRTGFTVVKTSVAGAAVTHRWHVYIHTRRFYQ